MPYHYLRASTLASVIPTSVVAGTRNDVRTLVPLQAGSREEVGVSKNVSECGAIVEGGLWGQVWGWG